MEANEKERLELALINVTLALKRHGLFNWELATETKINPTLLSKYLRGARPMPEKVKQKLFAALGIDKSLAETVVNKKAAKPRKAVAIGR